MAQRSSLLETQVVLAPAIRQLWLRAVEDLGGFERRVKAVSGEMKRI